jgi:hypothetical protein
MSTDRIAVTTRADGRLFVGNVEVTVEVPRILPPRRPGPLPLSDETREGLGRTWERALRFHSCRICHGPFIAHYSTHLCSDVCIAANRRAWLDAHRLPVPERLPSKATQRRAALASAQCLVCGAPFPARRLSARFCSNRCRQQHHRNGRKAE